MVQRCIILVAVALAGCNASQQFEELPDYTGSQANQPAATVAGHKPPEYPACAYRLIGHTDTIYSAAFSPDSRYLASGDRTGCVILWDLTTGKQRHVLRSHSRPASTLAFSPDGRHLASAGSRLSIVISDVAKGVTVTRLDVGRHGVLDLRFLPDGKRVVGLDDHAHIRQWDVTTGTFSETSLPRSPSVGFSANGRFAVIADRRERFSVWDISRCEKISARDATTGIPFLALDVSSDAKLVAMASKVSKLGPKPVYLWPAEAPEKAQTFDQDRAYVRDVRISPDRRFVVAVGSPATHPDLGKPTEKSSFTIWDTSNGLPLPMGHLEAGRGYGCACAFSPDNRYVATAGTGCEVRVWKLPEKD